MPHPRSASDWFVRRIEPPDLEAVAALYARSLVDSMPWLRPEQCHSEDEHRAFFRDVVVTRCEVWLAEQKRETVGVLAMDGDEVDRLYVATARQGCGAGSALVEHAKTLSPSGLRLVTLQRNGKARRFYERHGFSEYDYGTSPPPESEPDVWYRWP